MIRFLLPLCLLLPALPLLADDVPPHVQKAYPKRAKDVAMAGPFTEKPAIASIGPYAFGVLDFEEHVFAGENFPTLRFRDPEVVKELLGGEPGIEVRYYNAAGESVEAPEQPGRYGALIKLDLPKAKEPLIFTRDLFKVGSESDLSEDRSELEAMKLGAASELGHIPTIEEGDPGIYSARWWHQLKKQFNMAPEYDFFVLTPEAYDDSGETRYPAIIFLHGKGLFGKEGLEPLKEDWVVQLLKKRANMPVLFVAPKASDRWDGPAFEEMLDRLVAEYPVDPKAISVFGYSTGASGAWQLARFVPERLAGMVTLAGDPLSPEYVPRVKSIDVLAYYGDKDYPGPTKATKEMLEALAEVNPESRFVLLPGVNHGQLPGKVYHLDEIYEWMATRGQAE